MKPDPAFPARKAVTQKDAKPILKKIADDHERLRYDDPNRAVVKDILAHLEAAAEITPASLEATVRGVLAHTYYKAPRPAPYDPANRLAGSARGTVPGTGHEYPFHYYRLFYMPLFNRAVPIGQHPELAFAPVPKAERPAVDYFSKTIGPHASVLERKSPRQDRQGISEALCETLSAQFPKSADMFDGNYRVAALCEAVTSELQRRANQPQPLTKIELGHIMKQCRNYLPLNDARYIAFTQALDACYERAAAQVDTGWQR